MVNFSSGEIRDLIISMLVISLAFAIFFRNDVDGNYLLLISAVLIGVVPGFLFHELAHKFMAIRYGLDAGFKMYIPGLFIALIGSFMGIIFAAPGAVYINVGQSRDQLRDQLIYDANEGKIAIVGPLVNIFLAVLFVVLSIVSVIVGHFTTDISYNMYLITNSFWGYILYIGSIGFLINSTMAAFNMLPWSILDGSKVYDWNKKVWGLVAAAAFMMGGISYLLMFGII